MPEKQVKKNAKFAQPVHMGLFRGRSACRVAKQILNEEHDPRRAMEMALYSISSALEEIISAMEEERSSDINTLASAVAEQVKGKLK